MIKKFALIPVLFLLASPVFSQQKVVADKIAGIVADKIILKSELALAILDMQRNTPGADLKGVDECSILDNMLIQKALMVQAEKDSLPVSDDEVEAEVDQRIRYFIQQYGSKEAFEQIAGRTVYQVKQDFMGPIKEQRLASAMRNKIVEDVKITPQEVKEYYDKLQAQKRLAFYESQMQISQLVIYPKASRDIEKLAIDELNEYKTEVESGKKKFDVLAQLYTDDLGTKDKGGMLQMNRNDKIWDPTFFATAFRLKDGQVSPVIKSKFGYHIIQMVSRNGDDALVRHILKMPAITDAEIKETSAQMDTIRDLLATGKIAFGEAVLRFSNDDVSKSLAGQIMAKDGTSFLTIPDMDKDLVLLLKNTNLKVGEYSKPTAFTDDRGKKGVRVVTMLSKSEPHVMNMKDDYNRIAQMALDEKKSAVLEKWFLAKIPTLYVMIDGEYTNCSNLTKWQGSGNSATAGN